MEPVNILTIISDLAPAGPELRQLVLGKGLPPQAFLHLWVTSAVVPLLPEFCNAGIAVTVRPVQRGYLALGTAFCLNRYVRRRKIRVINVHDLKGFFLGFYARFLSGGAVKLVYHHVTAVEDYSRRQRHFFLRFVGLADHVVCNSQFSRKDLADTVPDGKIAVLVNGVDTGVFQPDRDGRQQARQEFGFGDQDVVVGMVAGFRAVKNHPLLLNGFAGLAADRKEMRLLCVGDGPELPSMRRLAKELGCADNIVFTGGRQDVAYCLQAMDILCLTSKWEGMPNALLEGMAAGLPVVASNVGGCGEVLLDGETGLLFPSQDEGAFCRALLSLVVEGKKRRVMGANGRRRVVENFSSNAMVNKYLSFFQRVAG